MFDLLPDPVDQGKHVGRSMIMYQPTINPTSSDPRIWHQEHRVENIDCSFCYESATQQGLVRIPTGAASASIAHAKLSTGTRVPLVKQQYGCVCESSVMSASKI